MEKNNVEYMKQMMKDHDILIEVRTKVDDMRLDVKEYQNASLVRITKLENDKLDKAEFYKLGHSEKISNLEKSNAILITENKIAIRNWTLIMGAVSILVSILFR